MKGSLVAALILIVVTATTSQALAATVRVDVQIEYEHGVPVETRTVVYEATDGEKNDVTVSGSTARMVVRDDGAGLTAGLGCSKRADSSVECGGQSIQVALGDDADRAAIRPAGPGGFFASVDGGAGDDTLSGADSFGVLLTGDSGDDTLAGSDLGVDSLSGGPGDDTLKGKGHADSLDGGGGRDALAGDAGDDYLQDGDHRDVRGEPDPSVPVDRDVINGGLGNDVVDYRPREGPLVVDLADSSGDGEIDENDSIRGVEGVYGGRGSDRLIGDGGSNGLSGGHGDDYLDGGPGDDGGGDAPSGLSFAISGLGGGDGDDTVIGGEGRDSLCGDRGFDRVDAGGGDDYVVSGDGNPRTETVICRDGADTVLPDRIDLLVGDCEQVTSLTRLTVDAQPAEVRPSGTVVFPFRCPAAAEVGCKVTLVLGKGRRRLGKRTRKLGPDTETKIGARLTARRVARLAGKRVRVTMKLQNARGRVLRKRKAAWTIELPRPPDQRSLPNTAAFGRASPSGLTVLLFVSTNMQKARRLSSSATQVRK